MKLIRKRFSINFTYAKNIKILSFVIKNERSFIKKPVEEFNEFFGQIKTVGRGNKSFFDGNTNLDKTKMFSAQKNLGKINSNQDDESRKKV